MLSPWGILATFHSTKLGQVAKECSRKDLHNTAHPISTEACCLRHHNFTICVHINFQVPGCHLTL